MTTTISSALIKLARRIGRWILERLAKVAVTHLIGYMLGRVDDFRRRLAKAKTQRRRTWLKGRILRWTNAANWLKENLHGLGQCAGAEFNELARQNPGIPIVAKCEKLVGA